MTRDEIDEMAREAGFHAAIGDSDLETFVEWRARTKALERFAKRIAAAERERCAEVCCTLERMRLDVFRNGGRLAEISPADCAVAIRGMK